MRATIPLLLLASCALAACATLPNRDPLSIGVAGIEPLPGEGLELRLAVRVAFRTRTIRPSSTRAPRSTLDLNGRKLASGVSDAIGTVPRYGEAVLTIPVTSRRSTWRARCSVCANAQNQRDVSYTVRGKLEGGWFGTRRFTDEGTFELPAPRE